MNFLQHFANFYKRNLLEVDSISQREFGIGTSKKINYRHKAFSNQRELQNFLVNETPSYISHSVGRFDFPWARPMEKKGLLSADLVFDLDSMPEEGHNYIFCNNCIESAKNDTIRLIEEFLVPIFGLSQSDFIIVFSGSKGFHIHVRCAAVQDLSANSRRLLVDYITGRDVKLATLLHKKLVYASESKIPKIYGPGIKSAGWGKYFYEEVVNALTSDSINIRKIKENKQRALQNLENGDWDFFHSSKTTLEKFLQKTISKHGVQVDSPVTFDVHRLIRVPGTIHGDTGFVAKPLTMNGLTDFKASRDAVAFRGKVAVNLMQGVSLHFGGEDVTLKQGEQEVSLALGVLLSCKGLTL